MPRRRADPARSILVRQRTAAEKLRREVLGADGSLRHPYFRDLRRQQRSYERAVGLETLYAACAESDVIYIGDFHAVPACQRFAADLLGEVARRVPQTALGVEFVYSRQQRLLDRRQDGAIDDPTFLRRIHYREEWGYPWDGFGDLLDRARELDVPVHALDVPPRGGFEGLNRRDEHAAHRIASILESCPGIRLVVLYGESHVSAGHIPRRVRSLLERRDHRIREATVFQDPDPVYWLLVSRGETLPRAVELRNGEYAVFHGSPLSKYEAYRQVLERWRGDVPPDEEVDLTPAVHHLIGVLLAWVGIRADRHRLHHPAGWSESLADALPEVYSGPEALDLLDPILEEYRRTPEEIREARARLASRGALYDSRSNTLFLSRYLPGSAAFEGARFLRAALSGRLLDPPEHSWRDVAARAYGSAYDEALAFLGSRLVDPTADAPGESGQRVPAAVGGSGRRRRSPEPAARTAWLDAHRDFETSGRVRAPADLLAPLRRSRPLRRALARELGRRLGETLFDRVRRGNLDSRGLRQLFKRTLTPDNAQRVVVQLLRTKKGRA